MPTRSELLSLIGELELDKELLMQLAAKHGRSIERLTVSAREEFDFAAVGYAIHNVYSAIESYALRVAKALHRCADLPSSSATETHAAVALPGSPQRSDSRTLRDKPGKMETATGSRRSATLGRP